MTDETGTVKRTPETGDAKMQPAAKPKPVQKPAAKGANPRPPMVKPGGGGGGKAMKPHKGRPQRRNPIEARVRSRHIMLIISFLALVVAPVTYANWYLHEVAADQYASKLSFTIESDDGPSVSLLGDLLGGDAGGGADDAEILYGFIQSQNLVEVMDERLDLRVVFNKPANDWYFRLGEGRSIEELVEYWQSMVLVAFDSGIVEVEVRSFDPDDSRAIAQAVLEESTILINRLSDEAREDAVRDAREYLEVSQQRLRDVRLQISELRDEEVMVNPGMIVEAAQRRVEELRTQVATERLRLDQLQQFAAEGDSRIAVTLRRIESLGRLIADEERKIASADSKGDTLSTTVGKFEELMVDRELAQQTYAVAQASYEEAKASARRKQRYLRAHISPTLAQTPEYPQRYFLGGLVAMFIFMGWVVLVMISYNIKDRR
ncbi:MAG: hypothetical protein AAF367_18690 [Pseudomonadota bacterium]